MPRTIVADGRSVTVPDDATPEEINQIFGPAPTAKAVQPVTPPIVNKGLGSAVDTVKAVGSHLWNAAAGPYHAFTDPLTPEEQKAFGTGQDVNAFGHAILGAKRLLIDPSARSIEAGNVARRAGDVNGAITNYAQALPVVGPMEKQAVETAQSKGALPAMAGLLTDLGVAKGVGRVADTIAAPKIAGDAMRDSGLGRINRYLGAGAKDLKNGANPANAVVQQVQGIPLTRGSISRQLNAAAPRLGQQLSRTVNAADANPAVPITKQSLVPAIEDPIAARTAEIQGPGGNNNVAPLETLKDSFQDPAPNTQGPIYGPLAPQQIPPSELWKTIQNVDKNTNFSTDPEVEGVNEVRRDIRGGLREQLEGADPTIKPLSRQYGDVMSARDVLARKPNANSGIPFSLPHVVGRTLNAAPIQVGLGKVANAVGTGVSAVGKVLNPANDPGNVGNAAVVGSLSGSTNVVNQNQGPNNSEIEQPNADQGEHNPSQNVQEPHAQEPTTTPEPEATLKPIDRQTAEGYYDQANGDPEGARELALMDGYTF